MSTFDQRQILKMIKNLEKGFARQSKIKKEPKEIKRPFNETIFILHISLSESEPLIWRRIAVPDTITFEKLHNIIQVAFGWDNDHLFEFSHNTGVKIGRKDEYYDDIEPARSKKLFEYLYSWRIFNYVYDFGDYWQLKIKVEKKLERDNNEKYPICLDGEMAGPPEDSGGIYGYYLKLETIKNPNDEEFEEINEWLGDDFDPNEFDKIFINKRLSRFKV